jgi:NADH:ubiquinone oxidoreductase subunit 5 (subunit L)/multisubunit Na+/H+ antiporter MnhA subunit
MAQGFIPAGFPALRRNLPLPWINIGALHIDFSFVLDQLSLVMLLVVTGVGFLIHVYSVGYMATKRATRATSAT